MRFSMSHKHEINLFMLLLKQVGTSESMTDLTALSVCKDTAHVCCQGKPANPLLRC